MVKSAYASVLAPGTRIEVGFKGIWSPGRVTAYVSEPIAAYSVVLDGIGPVEDVPAGMV